MPEQWRDRLEKLVALGCNAAEVYVPWNLHEPAPGQFRFDGHRDLVAFLELCQELGLDVVFRPGPYICAEWDFGGLPWWLLNQSDPVPLRSSDAEFLRCVEDWWMRQLFPRVKPFLAANGGPIIAIQVENEFGYWGSDKAYLQCLSDMLISSFGDSCPLLVTSDGTFWPDLQANGGLEGVLRTANFGSDPRRRLQELRAAQPTGPMMNMEFWVGWFDAWGAVAGKTYRAPEDVAQTLKDTLYEGASVNFFVFHGGTSFGFCGSGANVSATGQYEPQVTSYDYGGLLDEAGDVTEKYLRCREVIAEYLGRPELLRKEFPPATRLPSSMPLELEASVSLAAALPVLSGEQGQRITRTAYPVPMEQLGIGYGYVLYQSTIPPTAEGAMQLPLRLGQDAVRDFASVMLNGQVLGTVYRNDSGPGAREFRIPPAGGKLEILVEQMGRTNFGPAMLTERKGLVGPECVRLGSPFTGPLRAIMGWNCTSLPFDEEDLKLLPWSSSEGSSSSWSVQRGPRFFKYSLFVSRPADGFLVLEGFRKGFVSLNGFNLGRYWEVGPQQSLYMPAPLLQRGRNEIIIFDIDHPQTQARQRPIVRVVPEAVWTSGALPQGAKEALADAAVGLGKALRNFSSIGWNQFPA